MNTIGACGYIGTGSSAVSDLLKEYDENYALDKFEFKIAYQTDGLQDLKYHLNEGNMKYESGLSAIQRFKRLCKGNFGKKYNNITNGKFNSLVQAYIDSLVECRWIGLGADPAVDPCRLVVANKFRKLGFFKLYSKIEKLIGHQLNLYPFQEIYFSVYPEKFDSLTRNFITEILRESGAIENKNIILDQPFAGNSPEVSFGFFENPKAIVVDRDPRDYYISFREVYYDKGWRQVPVLSVDDFIHFYKKLRVSFPKINSEKILYINFEDLVYNYADTVKKIETFCNISNHIEPKKYFKPEMSISNTQLLKKYPMYADDISKIEKELGEYLFDYSPYNDINIDFSNEFVENPLNPAGRKWNKAR